MSVNLTINGQPVTVPNGTTILEAAKKVNIHIPTLCENSGLCRRAICRICVVECDGSSKLVAACANNVWEGMSVVTNNSRILDARKTILELLLANHPQSCLSCVRNKKCKLQTLAESFGIRTAPFERDITNCPPTIESETIVRDMGKCVKCASCVEVCQTVQAIGAINTSRRGHKFEIRTPYGQALNESFCAFCGQCAAVCPVGAIYEYDQTAKVWANLNSGHSAIAQVSPALAAALDNEFGLAAGTITAGKMAAAIKLLGFDKVFDLTIAANACNSKLSGELEERVKNGGKLPLVSGCSQGVFRFVENFYPDLIDHLSAVTPRLIFAGKVKDSYAAAKGLNVSNITSVSFVPCLAQKYGAGAADDSAIAASKTDFALTAGELARMINLAGIDIAALPEEPFDTINIEQGSIAKQTQKETVRSFAEARKVMEAIREGKCSAQWVEILSCHNENC